MCLFRHKKMESGNLSLLFLVLTFFFACSFVVGVFCDVTDSSDALLCPPSLHLLSTGKVSHGLFPACQTSQ